ncbi:MAG: hypothetical protein KF760_15675 [Candidatus Eremiobacteraeota bacterium]|nr:hypothetical protein [Candidatus Eremiobacteraeota bacterium]
MLPRRQLPLQGVDQGIPFEKSQAAHMSKVLGFPVTHEGLTKLYEGCLEGSHCYVTDVETTHNGFEYAISWRDHEGEELARAISHLARHPDGSLELHRSDVYVAHHCRGQAVNIKILEKEIAMVRQGSDHPESRITLEAGGMPVNGVRERLGTYTWARYGFDFADNYQHGVSDLVDYGGHQPGRQSMQRQFKAWIKNHAEPPLSQELNKLADQFKHPWEIAALKLEGHQFPVTVGDRTSQCDIGKAFMLSEFCENYGAVYRVNDPQFAGRPVAQKAFASQLKTARDRLTKERAELEQEFQSAPEKALEKLKQRGSSEWLPKLEALLQKRHDLKSKIEETIDAIRGACLLRGLKDQLSNHWTESTRSVLREQKERLETGWPGTVCHLGDRPVYYKWKAKFKRWTSNWFHTKGQAC